MCLSLFVGCGGDSGNNKTDTNSTVSNDGIFSTVDVKFIDENGESVYNIIRPEKDTEANSKAAFLYKQIKTTLGINIKNVADSADGTDAYEILVGETNRPETAKAKDYLIKSVSGRFDDYIICTIGKKIVIYSRSHDALQKACEYFVKNYVKTEGVKGGIKYTYAKCSSTKRTCASS